MSEHLPQAVKDFLDTIFKPPIEFLTRVVEYLDHVSLIAGKGINLGQYLSFVDYLPASWQACMNSLIASIVFLAILELVRVLIATYYNVKEGVKWW